MSIQFRIFLIGLLMSCTMPLMAEGTESQPFPYKLKPLYPDTVLVEQGQARCEIVVPDKPDYHKLAEQIRQAVRQATGADLAVRKDSELANLRGELTGNAPVKNVIVLGNSLVNGLIRHLTIGGYCSADAQYPGKGGYLVQSIHDPWGTGTNAVLLAGSDFAGVLLAIEQFIGLIPGEKSFILPRTLLAKYSTEVLESNKTLTSDPSDSEIQKSLEEAKAAFRGGLQGGLFGRIVGAGSAYGLTRHEGYAKQFREMLFLEYDLYRNEPASFDSPWGPAAEFLYSGLLPAWDQVEESPSLSDDDRRRIMQILLEFGHYYETHGYIPLLPPATLRHNHFTFPSLGFLTAGRYFRKYYPELPEGDRWIAIADRCFQLQQQSYRSLEDCSGYGWISTRHMCHYGTGRPDFTWYDSGKARMAGDLIIMSMDNLGSFASYGDVGGYNPGSHFPVLNALLTVEQDGRWAWTLEKMRRARKEPNPDRFPVLVKPYEPVDMLGIKCLPTDPLWYSSWRGKKAVPEQEMTFDKISFRSSFNPEKQYLLLDGLNAGYHGHWDGNSVLRFTDRSRIWLADSDYIKSLPKYHNSIQVLKDGQSAFMPVFCEKEAVADLGQTGMIRSTIRDYAGVDWSRNILWDKERAFVFIDELKARETDNYSFRCLWHTLGQPELRGNLYRVSQKGPSFSIRNLDGARLRCYDDPEIGRNWNGYPFADPVVQTLQQIRTQRLRAGDSVFFLNVLTTEPKNGMPVESARVSDSSILIGAGAEQSLAGVHSGDGEIARGIVTDARIYWLSRKRIALASATRLSVDGKLLFACTRPISIELDSDGSASVSAEKPCMLDIACTGSLRMDGNLVHVADRGEPVSLALPAGKHRLDGVMFPRGLHMRFPQPKPVSAANGKSLINGIQKLETVVRLTPVKGMNIAPIDADSSGIYIGGPDNRLHALNPDGQSRWEFDAGDEIQAVWTGKLNRDEPAGVAVGTVRGRIFVLDQSGKLVWKQQIPVYKDLSGVMYFTSADLNGDGNRALIAGSDNWYHYAFDCNGVKLWEYMSIRTSTTGAAVDLDGDGREEVVVGTEYNTLNAVKPDGSKLWYVAKTGGPYIYSITSVKNTEGKPLAIIGGAEGTVYALNADGTRSWACGMGDEVTCLGVLDNGSGEMNIIAGSRSFYVCAIRPDGTRAWKRDLSEPVQCMALADMNGDGSREIVGGTEEGNVVVLDRKGEPVASWTAASAVCRLVPVSGSPDTLVAACADGKVFLLRQK